MRNCLHCQLFWLRLRSIPASSGRWGKFLSCVIAAAWAATLWNHGPGLAELAGEAAIIQLFGLHAAATWMTIVAVAPLAGMLSGVIPLRLFAATLGLATWTSLLLEMVFQDGTMRPTMGACLAGMLGCLNADMRLAHLVAERRA
jgi:hypothetical protein